MIICAGCGQGILGAYVTALGRQWHPAHFVCTFCRQPLARGFLEHDGHPYCERDFHALFTPRCAVCDRPLLGAFLSNGWGDRYCPRHQDELPACYSCGRPICERLTGGGGRYPDGRPLCNLCRPTAVAQLAEGRPILDRVRGALAGRGIAIPPAPLPLRLVGQADLGRLAAAAGPAHPPAGLTRTLLTQRHGQTVGREVAEILVLYGLPAEHFAAVVAHELGHAWLFLTAFPALPPLVEEGLCELCAYLWLQTQPTRAAAYRLEAIRANPDPIYGRGAQLAIRGFEQLGLPALLAYIRAHRQFPP